MKEKAKQIEALLTLNTWLKKFSYHKFQDRELVLRIHCFARSTTTCYFSLYYDCLENRTSYNLTLMMAKVLNEKYPISRNVLYDTPIRFKFSTSTFLTPETQLLREIEESYASYTSDLETRFGAMLRVNTEYYSSSSGKNADIM